MRVKGAVAAVVLSAVMWSGCGMTIWGEPKTKNWKNATGAEAFERLFWGEVKAGNWAMVERKIALTFSGAGAGGPQDRAAFVESLKQLQLTDFTIGELTVRPNATDMVASYTIQLQTAAGQQTRHIVSVWQQVEKDWVMIAHGQADGRE